MTLNGTWGCMPSVPQEDWLRPRDILGQLCSVTGGGGNLLLNIGPESDGSIQKQTENILLPVGKWLSKNGGAVYGKVDRISDRFECHPAGSWNNTNSPWTLKGRTAYFWVTRWPGDKLVIGAIKGKVKKASLLGSGKLLRIQQDPRRLILSGLGKTNPDKIAGVSVIKMAFATKPAHNPGFGCV